jgi:hypothetical protein
LRPARPGRGNDHGNLPERHQFAHQFDARRVVVELRRVANDLVD